jgi:hypothetical protein
MLVSNSHHDGKITAYGSGIAKASGKAYFFIDFAVEGIGMRWMGSPMKADGTLNQMFTTQLAAAGYDAAKHTLADFNVGIGSNVLNENGTVKVRITQKPDGRGELQWSIAWIGEPKKLTKEELAAGLPANIDELMRKVAPKPTRATEDMIPF